MTPFKSLRAVMLDWAGTTVDHGSNAPVLALKTLFSKHAIDLAGSDARRDMGLLKRDHIRAILNLPNISQEWKLLKGHAPDETDVLSLFEEFGPLQMQIIAEHSQLIEGVIDVIAGWQRAGLKIGSTTGYTRAMLTPVMEQAAKGGYHPDASVCPDEVEAGRPAPWMLARNAQLLSVYPPSACVKIGDTISDIEEGRNAGMWTIGLTRTGNLVGLDHSDWQQLPEAEKQNVLAQAGKTMQSAGADFIAESLVECEPILRAIDDRVTAGNKSFVS